MEITRGRIMKALKIVIYGPEGIGKSTLASKFPEPVFIDTEGSTDQMDVARFPKPTSWTMLLDEVNYVKSNPTCCKTLVIDTADWAEQLCSKQVCSEHHVDGIESFGYGKGYVYLKEEFGKLLNMLSDLVEANINVVVTAHAMMRKFEQPDELGAYDRWELKLSKQCAPLVKEWSDMLLFCNYKTMVVNVDNQGATKGKNKARGGKRVIYTQHHPCWDAKNRFGLPDEIDMDYENIRPVIEGTQKKTDSETATLAPKDSDHSIAAMTDGPSTIQQKAAPAKAETKSKEPEPEDQLAKASEKSADPAEGFMNAPENEVPFKDEKKSLYISDPDKIPKELRDLMEQDRIGEWEVQDVVMARGYYPENTLIQDMNPEFVKGWIVTYWPQVKQMALEIRDKEEVAFN